MQLINRGLKPYRRKFIVGMVTLIMFLNILVGGSSDSALAKVGESCPAPNLTVIKADGFQDTTLNQQILDESALPEPSKYELTPVKDEVYTTGETPDGIMTMTVNPDYSGMKYFGIQVTWVKEHEGLETIVFTHWRDGTQLTINAIRADFDIVPKAQAGFNVESGDIIKAYIVDQLSNDADCNPVPLQ
jgi:hypothetical protein